jgi:hypothetical protein
VTFITQSQQISYLEWNYSYFTHFSGVCIMSPLREQISQAVRLSLALTAAIGVMWGIQTLWLDGQQQVPYPVQSVHHSR